MLWIMLFIGLLAMAVGHYGNISTLKEKEKGALDEIIIVDGVISFWFGYILVYLSCINLLKIYFGDIWWLRIISIISMLAFSYYILKSDRIYNMNKWPDKLLKYIALIAPIFFITRDLLALL